jgi:hypothetical protein
VQFSGTSPVKAEAPRFNAAAVRKVLLLFNEKAAATATGAVQFSGTSPVKAEAPRFNAANQTKTEAVRSSVTIIATGRAMPLYPGTAARRALLLCSEKAAAATRRAVATGGTAEIKGQSDMEGTPS